MKLSIRGIDAFCFVGQSGLMLDTKVAGGIEGEVRTALLMLVAGPLDQSELSLLKFAI